MRRRLSFRISVLALLAAMTAGADPIEMNQVPWSVRLFGSEISGGFAFLPAIDAATMEPIRFAFSANRTWDPGRVENGLFSTEGISEAYGRYGEMVGSGAFGFLVFVEPVPFEPLFYVPPPQYWTVQYFEAGEAPEWDPDNPPPLDQVWVEPEDPPLDEDPEEELPQEALEAVQAVSVDLSLRRYTSARASSSDPVILLESQIDLNTPEPSTFLLVGGGIALAGVLRHRRRQRPPKAT